MSTDLSVFSRLRQRKQSGCDQWAEDAYYSMAPLFKRSMFALLPFVIFLWTLEFEHYSFSPHVTITCICAIPSVLIIFLATHLNAFRQTPKKFGITIFTQWWLITLIGFRLHSIWYIIHLISYVIVSQLSLPANFKVYYRYIQTKNKDILRW